MEVKFPFQIFVKPGSGVNKLYYNNEKQVYILDIKVKAEDNKANIEVIKFLSRLLNKQVRIVKGFKSRSKLIDVV